MEVKQKCVEMGSGVFGKFVYDKNLTQKEEITVETLAGIKKLKLNIENKKVKTVKVDMGEPILEPEKIPVITEKCDIPVKALDLQIIDKKFSFTCISMGNPHAVTFIDNIKEFELEKYGSIVETDKHFPKKVNVEFIKLVNETYMQMRVWERGSGETLACGTGACATVVAAILNGYASKNTSITVELLGGKLEIEWNETDNHIYMTGPANIVFEGNMEIEY